MSASAICRDFQAEDARLLLLVDKGWIGIPDEPVVVIEGGVVDAVGSAGADIGRGHSLVLQKRGVVGAEPRSPTWTSFTELASPRRAGRGSSSEALAPGFTWS